MILRARWLLRPAAPPIENAAIVTRDGRVVEACAWSDLVGPTIGRRVTDLGDAILVPGFVNAHTHLRLSHLRGQFPRPKNFVDWLSVVVKATWNEKPETIGDAVSAGAAESLAAGVTALADTSYDGRGEEALAEFPIRSTVFVEVYGHTKKQSAARLASAVAAAARLETEQQLRVGLSPHAPYTAGPLACLAAAREAAARGWPITMHLHETPDEIELYVTGRGAFKKSLITKVILAASRFKPSGRSPIQTLAAAGFFSRPVLAAHGNYLDDADIGILRASGSTVVYCPRSHDYFGHTGHPYRRLLAAGVPVALGTDSLASSPSLSILDELRFLRARDPELPGEVLLAMATAAGADALGLGGLTGRLAKGEEADLVAVGSPRAATEEPYAALFDAGATVDKVWIRGTEVVVR
jgi:cytosine/adenosine deaminase-related metal-dependent hydrolase